MDREPLLRPRRSTACLPDDRGTPDQVTDERGYFDRQRVKRTLGSSGPKYWLPGGPVPPTGKLGLLAQLLNAPVDDVTTAVEQERTVRREHASMVSRCRHMPYLLMSYEEVRAGFPCPGCGRPWTGPRQDEETERRLWQEQHTTGDCITTGEADREAGGRAGAAPGRGATDSRRRRRPLTSLRSRPVIEQRQPHGIVPLRGRGTTRARQHAEQSSDQSRT
jgi:hypothetical protein